MRAATPDCGAEVAEVRDQPVRDVDRARRHPDQRRPEREPGLGQAEALGKRGAVLRRECGEFAAHCPQAQRRVADGAGDVDVVARARARAGETGACSYRAEGGERQHCRPLGRHRVAADQRDAEFLLVAGEPGGKILHPCVGDAARQGEAERVRSGFGTHGGEVREVHAQQAAGDGRRCLALRVVDAGHHEVLGDDEARALRRRQQRPVVAECEGAGRGAAQGLEVAGDEVEFSVPGPRGHGPLRPPSPPRGGAAPGCRARR